MGAVTDQLMGGISMMAELSNQRRLEAKQKAEKKAAEETAEKRYKESGRLSLLQSLAGNRDLESDTRSKAYDTMFSMLGDKDSQLDFPQVKFQDAPKPPSQEFYALSGPMAKEYPELAGLGPIWSKDELSLLARSVADRKSRKTPMIHLADDSPIRDTFKIDQVPETALDDIIRAFAYFEKGRNPNAGNFVPPQNVVGNTNKLPQILPDTPDIGMVGPPLPPNTAPGQQLPSDETDVTAEQLQIALNELMEEMSNNR